MAIGGPRPHRSVRAAAVLVAVLVVAWVPPPAAAAGGATWVETFVSRLGYPSLAIDDTGRRHVVTGGGPLVYLTTKTGVWRETTVDPQLTWTTALALDGSRKAHVAYDRDDSTAPGIYYATNRSGAWRSVRLTTSITHANPKIAVTAGGEAHVVFEIGDGIGYATNRRGYWIALRLTAAPDVGPSIDLDASRRVHVAFGRGSPSSDPGLYYLTDATGAWVSRRLSTNGAWSTALKMRPDGAIGIAYLDEREGLSFTTNKSGGWVTNLRVGNCNPANFAMEYDAGGHAHIACPSGDATWTFTDASGSWRSSIVTRWYATAASIALDPAGVEVVVSDGANGGGGIVIASATGRPWTIATATTNAADLDSVVAVDSAGAVHIAFQRGTYGIRYRTNRTGTWTTVAATTGTDTYPSLAVDATGHAHVAFIRYASGVSAVWHATNASGSWVATKVADGSEPPRLALDAAGHAWIVAVFEHYPGVRYVTNATGAWSAPKEVAPNGAKPDLAIDGNGKLHIVCRSSTTGRVRYLTNASGSWVGSNVPGGETPNTGWIPIRIALDAAGQPHIAYTEGTAYATDGIIRYARRRSGTWETMPQTDLTGGMRPEAIAVDADGNPHMVATIFSDPPGDMLFELTDAGGVWSRRFIAEGVDPDAAIAPDGSLHVVYAPPSGGGLRWAHD